MVDNTISQPATIEPPFRDPILDASGRMPDTWVSWFTRTSDRVASMWQTLATIKDGVTDGSDAAAGQIGEYLIATSSGSLTTSTAANIATLTLSAGDWDVAGSALFSPSHPNVNSVQAWISAADTANLEGGMIIQAQDATTTGVLQNEALVVGPVRFSSNAPAALHLGCQAIFPTGTTVTATAWIKARRVR